MSKIAIFLGAGASKAEGAPLQGELFRKYFSSTQFKHSKDPMDKALATFFNLMFGINVRLSNIGEVQFPTFEEVLGLTDLAVIRKESFRFFNLENRAVKSKNLRFIAQYLVFLVAKVLDAELQHGSGLHKQLVKKLQKKKLLKDVIFVSTNYDILIDNALTELFEYVDLDYGVDFRNFDREPDWKRPDPKRQVSLFKPHGSLNWLFCPTCNQLEITPKEKGVVTRLISDFSNATCPYCESVYVPMIVPPTYYKDLTNAFLSSIWHKADVALKDVEHVVFCGYSFPDADIHIKYLLKRAQTNRDSPLRFTVINHFPNKPSAICADEQYRYKRFLGENVSYTNMSFEEFASNPLPILK